MNIVAPGLTKTSAAMSVNTSEDIWKMYETETALKRAGVPGDLLGAVMFFASVESDYITGQTLIVNGGYTFV